ncbi:MAG: hypothetical protein ACOCV8_01865 [Spirochaetota bacterium]
MARKKKEKLNIFKILEPVFWAGGGFIATNTAVDIIAETWKIKDKSWLALLIGGVFPTILIMVNPKTKSKIPEELIAGMYFTFFNGVSYAISNHFITPQIDTVSGLGSDKSYANLSFPELIQYLLKVGKFNTVEGLNGYLGQDEEPYPASVSPDGEVYDQHGRFMYKNKQISGSDDKYDYNRLFDDNSDAGLYDDVEFMGRDAPSDEVYREGINFMGDEEKETKLVFDA